MLNYYHAINVILRDYGFGYVWVKSLELGVVFVEANVLPLAPWQRGDILQRELTGYVRGRHSSGLWRTLPQ